MPRHNRTAPVPHELSRRSKVLPVHGLQQLEQPRGTIMHTPPPAPLPLLLSAGRRGNMRTQRRYGTLYPPMKPTFRASPSAIERDRREVVLVIPPCLQSPPDDTKAPVLPVKRAAVAMAARMV